MKYSSILFVGVLASIFQQGWAKDSGNTCGCGGCNEKTLERMAGDHTCGERIHHLMNALSFEEDDACHRVAVVEFPDECGKCACGLTKQVDTPGYYCGSTLCTPEVWGTMTEEYSCGARITYARDFMEMSEADACELVAESQFPQQCGKCNPKKYGDLSKQGEEPVDVTIKGLRCGCMECDENVWNTDADTFTCGERISWLVRNKKDLYPSVKEACMQVAGREFGQCSGCNPVKCGSNTDESEDISPMPIGLAGTGYTETTLTARTPLYCFLDFKERTRWRNVWGKYTVEVKESDQVCGPSNNKFTTNTVSLLDKNQLKLQFKKVGNTWEASEVRVRLPEAQMPFLYGKFSFSVKSVEVIDIVTGDAIDNKLPPTLILGLFTWDDTEDYATHENFNHEVDIEISRWGKNHEEDLQFLVRLNLSLNSPTRVFSRAIVASRFLFFNPPQVQPPGDEQMARFYSGGGTSYKQGRRSFSFDWRPAEIEWFGDRGESHLYSASTALAAGVADHTQCLPADMAVRMNLWHLYGSSKPAGMANNHVVEVVIDNFAFAPNGLTVVPEGGVCTKDCQCGSSSRCASNMCRGTSRKLEGTESLDVTDDAEETYRTFVREGSRDALYSDTQYTLSMRQVLSMTAAVVFFLWVFRS